MEGQRFEGVIDATREEHGRTQHHPVRVPWSQQPGTDDAPDEALVNFLLPELVTLQLCVPHDLQHSTLLPLSLTQRLGGRGCVLCAQLRQHLHPRAREHLQGVCPWAAHRGAARHGAGARRGPQGHMPQAAEQGSRLPIRLPGRAACGAICTDIANPPWRRENLWRHRAQLKFWRSQPRTATGTPEERVRDDYALRGVYEERASG